MCIRDSAQGGTTHVVDLQFADGPCQVTGVVRDQDGGPAEELPVLAFYWGPTRDGLSTYGLSSVIKWGVTDATGRYRIDGLPQVQVAIQVDPYGNLGEVGENRIRRPARQLRADLRLRTGLVEMEPVEVIECRPYRLQGRVDATAEELRRVRVRLSYLDLETSREEEERLKVERDGSFTWACDTPHPPVTLQLSMRKGASADPRVLFPEPHRVEDITLTVP